MKKFKILLTGIILIFSLFISCNDFGDINTDPTQPTNLNPVYQLTDAQMRFTGESVPAFRAGLGITIPLLQQFGGTFANKNGEDYTYSDAIYSRAWTDSYPTIVLNMVDAVERTNGIAERSNLNAMCRILKVIVFMRFTDLYGDIPYFEGGKGYSSLIAKPKFDAQKDIYDDFFKELKESFNQLDSGKDNVTTDQFYAGDVVKWKKLANSLRLRCAMRLVKIDPAKAKLEAEAAYTDGLILSNEDNCITKHENIQCLSGTEHRGNGLNASILSRSDVFRMHTTMVDMLKPSNVSAPADPRLYAMMRCYYPLVPLVGGLKQLERIDITSEVDAYYAALTGNNAYSGIIGLATGAYSYSNLPKLNSITINVPGLGNKTIAHKDQRRQLANFLIRFDAPSFIVTCSEMELLLAEAKIRGWNVGSLDANTHYKNGIKAAIEQLTYYPEAPVITGTDAFVASMNLTPGNEFEQINTQLYLALFLNYVEGFSNWRRSGYPVLNSTAVGETPTPRRFAYPLAEFEQNKENCSEAIARIIGVGGNGVDSHLNRVWWDKE